MTCSDTMDEPLERTDASSAPSRGCWGSLGREPADHRRRWESWPHCHDTRSCIGMYASMWSVKGHGMDTLRARPKGFCAATLAAHHHTPPGRGPRLSRRRGHRQKCLRQRSCGCNAHWESEAGCCAQTATAGAMCHCRRLRAGAQALVLVKADSPRAVVGKAAI